MNRNTLFLLNILSTLKHGSLALSLPDGQCKSFGDQQASGLHASIAVQDWGMFDVVVKSGDIGLAQSYMAGQWSSPDLAALLKLCILNRQHFEKIIYGSWWGNLLYRAKHWLNSNSKHGSRKNIHAHYDLGNSFYALWLDKSWNYSSAMFEGDLSLSLQAAQQIKMARALRQAAVVSGSRVLEIGCGWGAVAQLASEQGAQLVGITLSQEQLDFGKARLEKLPTQSSNTTKANSTLEFLDYRDVTKKYGAQSFDAVVSIEMFEAVGQAYWDSYFSSIYDALKPRGRACVQTIYIAQNLFDKYQLGTDFIQQYVFPGGMLPSQSAFVRAAQKAGLRVIDCYEFGSDYAETLRRWRSAFMNQLKGVRALGFDDTFIRLWEFYLVYCEAAFDTKNTGVAQYTLERAPK